MPVTMKITGIDELVQALGSVPAIVTSGVKTTDELNYIKALVWDMGYVTRVIKPGPKTLWSVNVLGEPKVLTITAPTGFIRVQRQQYLAVLRDEFAKAQFARHPIGTWAELATTMMTNAAQRCAQLVSNAAPIDTGQLRQSIVAAPPGDGALAGEGGFYTSGYGPYGTFDVGDLLSA
jgi:hypothetical protein